MVIVKDLYLIIRDVENKKEIEVETCFTSKKKAIKHFKSNDLGSQDMLIIFVPKGARVLPI